MAHMCLVRGKPVVHYSDWRCLGAAHGPNPHEVAVTQAPVHVVTPEPCETCLDREHRIMQLEKWNDELNREVHQLRQAVRVRSEEALTQLKDHA